MRTPLRRRPARHWWEVPEPWHRRLLERARPGASAPEPTVAATEGRMPYLPALDGLRAIALVAVLCFHTGFDWIHGGYLPLTSFFVLSGFLITSLLLLEQGRSGRIGLRAFWGRRARRLVPAAILALGLVALYTAAIGRSVPGLQGDVYACLGWVANWRFIFIGRSYADLFGDPSPVQHFWSLAVEEQFYVVFPLIAVGTLYLARGRRWLLALVTVELIAGSTVIMRFIHHPGEPPLRAYFGTDTRAAELLVGVLLALVLIGPKGLRRLPTALRWLVNLLGAAALGVSVVLWFVTREYDDRLYEGGLLGIAVLAALVVASATQAGSPVSWVLGLRPLAALGRISYGVYLFHWPLFLWMNEQRTGLDGGPLFALRMAVTVGLAVLSYHLVEQPIRLGTRSPAQLLLTGWANASVAVAAVVVLASTASPAPHVTVQTAADKPEVIRATTTTLAGTSTTDGATTSSSGGGATTTRAARSNVAAASSDAGGSGAPSGTTGTTARPASTTAPAAPPPPRPLRVMVVGDSIAVNLGVGLGRHLQKYGDMEVLNYAANGCPAATDGIMRWPDGSLHTAPLECGPRRADWGPQIYSFKPDIVLVHSSIFDILDRQQVGWPDFYHLGQPTYDAWLADQQRQVIGTLRSGGAKVVWATTPCARFDPAHHPNHHDDVEGNRRIDLLNALIRRAGTTVADFDAHVCPGGGYSSTVDGVAGARYDGVHFTDVGAEAIADRWLAPLLLSMR